MASVGSGNNYGIQILWEGKSNWSGEDRLNADVIFVHGLNGDRVNTWKTKAGVFWPADLLPQKLPECRVMSFGYNADLGPGSSRLGIRDFAVSLLSELSCQRQKDHETNRPIIFVCHSLGGIVAKKALLVAHLDGQYENISRNTMGVIFFGTPHRGSSAADFATILNGFAPFLGRRDLLSSLTRDNEALFEISRDFVAVVGRRNYSITSFYEGSRVANVGVIVKYQSAIMNITQEKAIPLNGDHREICRFDDREDSGFKSACDAIRGMIPQKNVQALSTADEEYLASITEVDIEVCLQTVKSPFGDSCAWIENHEHFVSLQTSPSLQVLHIIGKPGSGKSTLAGCLYRGYFNSSLDRPVFFFSFAEGSRTGAASAWGCLLRQLLEYNPTKLPAIHRRSRLGRWTDHRLRTEFETLAKEVSSRTSMYIIDAIDECDGTVREFLDSVASILLAAGEKTKFIFLGRREGSLAVLKAKIREENLEVMEIDKEREHLQAIEQYVVVKVRELCEIRPGLRPKMDEIVKMLCEKSEGLFLLPELAIASLEFASGYDEKVMEELERMPPEMGSIYGKALRAVLPNHRSTVSTLILWLAFRLRHLSQKELSFILASNTDQFAIKRYLADRDPHHGGYFDILGDAGVRAILGTVVKRTDISGDSFTINLVHGTARRYLISVTLGDSESAVPAWLTEGLYGGEEICRWVDSRPETGVRPNRDQERRTRPPSRTYGRPGWLENAQQLISGGVIDPPPEILGFAHQKIFQQCWDCLRESLKEISIATPWSDYKALEPRDYKVLESRVPLFSYAAENIFEHARLIPPGDLSKEFYYRLAEDLERADGQRIRRCFWHFKDPGGHQAQPLLHFACELGLEGLVSHLVKEPSQTFVRYQEITPLEIAAATGNVPILKLLCETERSPYRAGDSKGGTAELHKAIEFGHLEAAKYLIKRVRRPRDEFRADTNPIEAAVTTDNVSMLELFEPYDLLNDKSVRGKIHKLAKRYKSHQVLKYLEKPTTSPITARSDVSDSPTRSSSSYDSFLALPPPPTS